MLFHHYPLANYCDSLVSANVQSQSKDTSYKIDFVNPRTFVLAGKKKLLTGLWK